MLRERIAAPLGFPDELFFGMPEDKRGSLARLVDAPSEVDWSTMQLPEDLPMFRAAPMSLFPNADLGNDPEVIGADIPAGGKTSARAIAKMYAALLAEVNGLRLISPEGLEQAATLAVEGKDEVFGNQVRWTLGYALGGPSVEEGSETTFGRCRYRHRHVASRDQEPADRELRHSRTDCPHGFCMRPASWSLFN